MSSHHFVKEGQEPALLCLDPDALSYEQLGGLLAWVPLLMADIRCLDTLLDWQVKVDVLLCAEEQREDVLPKLTAQAPVSILTYQREEEALATGLYYLQAKRHEALSVAVAPARLDAVWLQAVSMMSADFPVTVYSRQEKGFPCGHSLDKWLAAETCVRLMSTLYDMEVKASGFGEDAYKLKAGEWLELQKTADGRVHLSVPEEGLWYFEEVFAP